jgi:hypothetical protein
MALRDCPMPYKDVTARFGFWGSTYYKLKRLGVIERFECASEADTSARYARVRVWKLRVVRDYAPTHNGAHGRTRQPSAKGIERAEQILRRAGYTVIPPSEQPR